MSWFLSITCVHHLVNATHSKPFKKTGRKIWLTGQVSWCIQSASFELPHLTFQTAALILTTTLIKTCQQTQISHKRSALLFSSQQPSCGWQYWKIHFGCHTHFNCPITTSKSFHSDFKTAGPLVMPFSLPRDKTPKKNTNNVMSHVKPCSNSHVSWCYSMIVSTIIHHCSLSLTTVFVFKWFRIP